MLKVSARDACGGTTGLECVEACASVPASVPASVVGQWEPVVESAWALALTGLVVRAVGQLVRPCGRGVEQREGEPAAAPATGGVSCGHGLVQRGRGGPERRVLPNHTEKACERTCMREKM